MADARYLVVESFDKKGQREASVVPYGWIKDDVCYWPDSNVTQHVKKKTVPNSKWSTFKFKVLKDNIGRKYFKGY